MSTFRYHKPGIGNASSYIVSGIPWYTSSVAPPLSTTSTVVNLPRVTNYITIKNVATTEDVLRFTFNADNIVDNTNYITLESGESFSAELRTTDVHLISDTETPVPFTIIAGLTNIDRTEMYGKIPKAPNLLAWVQKQKILSNDPDGSSQGDWFGWSTSTNNTGDKLAVSSYSAENGSAAGAVYIFQNSSSGYQQVQKITASFNTDGSPETDRAGDRFGAWLSMNDTGNTLAIGAWGDNENESAAGAAYIFQSSSLGYQQIQKLTASFNTDGSPETSPTSDNFGNNASLNSVGDILLISAVWDEENGSNAGAAYIFQSSSLGYQQIQKLTASFSTSGSSEINTPNQNFGFSTSINSVGDKLAIGAYTDNENGSNAGAAYIFQSSSLGYQQIQKLTASGDADSIDDYFGISVSMNNTGNIVAIGAFNDEENGGGNGFGNGAGAVYIFESGSSGYQQVQKITASFNADGSPETDPAGDRFGYLVSLDSEGENLFISAYQDEENGDSGGFLGKAGAVYVFKNKGSGFVQIQKIIANDPDGSPEGDRFSRGLHLSVAGNIAIVGAVRDEENGIDAGAAYVFKYTRDY